MTLLARPHAIGSVQCLSTIMFQEVCLNKKCFSTVYTHMKLRFILCGFKHTKQIKSIIADRPTDLLILKEESTTQLLTAQRAVCYKVSNQITPNWFIMSEQCFEVKDTKLFTLQRSLDICFSGKPA